MTLQTPPYLKKGDSIAIVATARKISEAELQPAIDLIQKWGLKVVLGASIGAEENQFAGSDTVRTKDFQEALDNPKIKAIWCARGGYGTVRMLDALDFSAFKMNPKWIVGYSDITVLHSHMHKLGFETLHAQMPLEIEKKTEATRQSIATVLFGNDYKIEGTSRCELHRNGTAKGQLVGGNLSVLYSLCGSETALKTKGKILFLEDLDEYLYHMDRMMQNLKRNGMLNNLAGLIVGGMTDMNDNTIPFGKTAEQIIWDSVKEFEYPVCFDFPAGHVNDNRALILGRETKLIIEQNKIKIGFNSPLEGDKGGVF